MLFAAVQEFAFGTKRTSCPLSRVKRTRCRRRALRFSGFTIQKNVFSAYGPCSWHNSRDRRPIATCLFAACFSIALALRASCDAARV